MRNLREKLKAVATTPSVVKPVPLRKDSFFCRERIVPYEEVSGITQITLDEIRTVDPLFTGNNWEISRVLFLDTETTGLSGGAGTVAFEIGIGFIDHRGLVIRQYVMRDYGEESAMLTEIAELIKRFDVIVSFNGKSFDIPLLESRMIMCRIRLPLSQMPNLDLLHASRRVYKLRLRRCNLTALEEAVLGHVRTDDLPGSQVPQRYFDYIRTGDFSLLEDVLRHNFEDVKNLAVLTAHLCSVFRAPQVLEHPEDIFSVGKTLIRGGKTQKARNCFKILSKSTLAAQAHLHLSSSFKKEHEWQNACACWMDMIAGGEGGTYPYIELAKYYEHVAHDIPRALEYANAALRFVLNTALLSDENAIPTDPILRRIKRLKHKKEKISKSKISEDI